MLPPRLVPSAAAFLAAGALLSSLLAAPASAGPEGPGDARTGSTGSTGSPAAVVVAKQAKDPRKRLGLYVDPRMPAAQQGAAYRRIAQQPQALWFGNEYYPIARVASVAREYTRLAAKARKTPVLVVYSIPDRDCGQYSQGGLPGGKAYQRWVKRLAKGIRGSRPLVILEPDAIPFYGQGVCANGSNRLALIRYAARVLTRAGAWVYLDAGHSNWTPYAGRARLLKKAGIRYARGFSTNVSNFRTTASEHAYARTLLRDLRKLGVRGKKYVIDTSRNGAAPQDDRVINPAWARVGAAPRLRFRGAFDGTLWVKHPGESDGTECGGPSSGAWSNLLADRLLGRVPGARC